MKYSIAIALFFLAQLATAQLEFIHIDSAKSLSKEASKPIMLVFSGSDWCKPCIQLKKELLDTEKFNAFKDQLIYMNLDFPYKKKNALSKEEQKHNDGLADAYNPRGEFPKMVIIDSEGAVLADIRYTKILTTELLIEKLSTFTK